MKSIEFSVKIVYDNDHYFVDSNDEECDNIKSSLLDAWGYPLKEPYINVNIISREENVEGFEVKEKTNGESEIVPIEIEAKTNS